MSARMTSLLMGARLVHPLPLQPRIATCIATSNLFQLRPFHVSTASRPSRLPGAPVPRATRPVRHVPSGWCLVGAPLHPGSSTGARQCRFASSDATVAATASAAPAASADVAATVAADGTVTSTLAVAGPPVPAFVETYVGAPVADAFAYVHHSLDLPWVTVVVGVTFAARFLLFPIFISMQRNGGTLPVPSLLCAARHLG